MARVYNSFQIKLDDGNYADRVKVTAETLFRESNYKMQDEFLVWDSVDVSDGVLSAERYGGAGDNDLEKSRNLFEELCRRIVKEFPMTNFMGKHSFDYSNTDTTDYLLCFRKGNDLTFYQAEIVDDVGCMNAKRYSLKYALLKFEIKEELEFDDYFFGEDGNPDNDFVKVLEGYDSSQYPKISPKDTKHNASKKESVKAVKTIMEKGKLYYIQCDQYGKEKEVIGLLDDHFSKTYLFRTFWGDMEAIEEPDIRVFKEVSETEEAKKIITDYESAGKEIDIAEEEMTRLRDDFYSLYSTDGDSWKKKPLKRIDIGKDYPGIEGVQPGATYFVKVKKGVVEVGIDIVLAVNRYEDAFGGGFRVLGCVPGICNSSVDMIRPIVVWNSSEFTDELFPSEAGLAIQQKRVDLYNKVQDLHRKRKQLKEKYLDSFRG